MSTRETTLVGEDAFDWPAEPLAQGGMAVVYRARDRRLPREVILKRPRTADHDGGPIDPAMVRQFEARLEAEALILARLQHPSIVTIHELGRSRDGAPFCVLARIDGSSLRDRIDAIAADEAADGRPRTRERLELVGNLVAIAEALACAHERGAVHRDVTPNNILIGPLGEATLIDWGIAKDTGQRDRSEAALADVDWSQGPITGEGATQRVGGPRPLAGTRIGVAAADGTATIIAGTPPYLPLEQAQGLPAEPSFDVYSFGATLYQVISGRLPFETANVNEFLGALERGERPPPAAPRDPELSGIIARCMATRPEDRFTAAELVRALKEYLTGELVFSHRYSLTGRLARWVRKRRAAAIALVVVALAGLFSFFTWSALSQRADRTARRAAETREAAARDVARAEATAATKARETATAEQQRSAALATAASKEQEAHLALDAAERADKSSREYRELQLVAEKKREDADAARTEADRLAVLAQTRADEAQSAADAARADAERTRREAEETVSATRDERDAARREAAQAGAERDAAISARQAAEAERDQASAARQAAEAARDQAAAAQQAAETERSALADRVRALEAALGARGGAPDAGR